MLEKFLLKIAITTPKKREMTAKIWLEYWFKSIDSVKLITLYSSFAFCCNFEDEHSNIVGQYTLLHICNDQA